MQAQNQKDIKDNVSGEKLYELSMIEQMCRGDQEQIKMMVGVFIEEVPLSVEEIKTAYHKKDFESIKITAHRIKPTLTYYGVTKMESNIVQIEVMAEEVHTSTALSFQINKLDTIVTKVVEQMKKDFLY